MLDFRYLKDGHYPAYLIYPGLIAYLQHRKLFNTMLFFRFELWMEIHQIHREDEQRDKKEQFPDKSHALVKSQFAA